MHLRIPSRISLPRLRLLMCLISDVLVCVLIAPGCSMDEAWTKRLIPVPRVGVWIGPSPINRCQRCKRLQATAGLSPANLSRQPHLTPPCLSSLLPCVTSKMELMSCWGGSFAHILLGTSRFLYHLQRLLALSYLSALA